MRHLRAWVLGLLLATASVAQAGLPLVRTGGAEVQLLPGATGVAPGGTLELAIRFKLQDGWHIYWRNRGDGGQGPEFIWRLPDGWKVDRLQYPPPQRHVEKASADTFILEGEPVILATLTAPASAKPGTTADIGLQAKWLECKNVCVPGEKRLSAAIPVVESPGLPAPANQEVFRSAKAALPQPAGKAKYIKISAVANVDQVRPGAAFKVAVVLDIPDEYHLNSHEPLSEYLIGTDVFNELTDGLEIDRPAFPAGIVSPGPEGMEAASLYRRRTIVLLPVKAGEKLVGDQVQIRGVVTYQVCSDRTQQCYAPTAAEWELALPVAKGDESIAAANSDVFAAAAKQTFAAAKASGGPAMHAEGQLMATPLGAAAQPAGAMDSQPLASTREPSGGQGKGMSGLGALQEALARYGLFGYLAMAVLGGFLLNLMPCVLPVISIKVLSFVQQAQESRTRVLSLGVSFAAGILLSFIALGVFVVLLGRQWGGLFQYPQMVIGLAAVVTAFALSLFGVFTLNAPRFIGGLGERTPKEGLGNAFCMGLLATALGTACTAPFLGFVIAIASQQTALIGMAIFLAAGMGMAFPYVLLASHPAWLKVIPRPGPWLNIFEEVMGFVLMGTVIWLLNTVFAQIGGQGLMWTLVFLLFVSTAAWLYGKVAFDATRARKMAHYTASLVLIATGWVICFRVASSIPELVAQQRAQWLAGGATGVAPSWEKDIPWLPYTRDRAQKAVDSGKTVFVDYTAEWCANCKANEKLVINTAAVREAMTRLGIVPFRANYTWLDPEIKADLDRYRRGGVPMYLVIPAGRPKDGFVLNELLTQSSLIAALEKAGPSTVQSEPVLQAEREQPPRTTHEMQPPPQPLGTSQ
jgi:thiol:disulfide interchange protein